MASEHQSRPLKKPDPFTWNFSKYLRYGIWRKLFLEMKTCGGREHYSNRARRKKLFSNSSVEISFHTHHFLI